MGHPLAMFLSPPDPNYRCAICLDVFDDPVSLLQCGHAFCRSCLESSIVQRANSCETSACCPECRTEIDLDDSDEECDDECREGNGNVVHPVRVLRNAIGNLQVRCRNCADEDGADVGTVVAASNDNDNDNGAAPSSSSSTSPPSPPPRQRCNWTGPLSSWHIHSSHHCPIAPATCPVPGCTHTCPRSQMKSHVGSSSCIEAAAARLTEERIVDAVRLLKKQMKRETSRKTKEREERWREEREELEARVESEREARLALREKNRALLREVEGLRKKLMRADEEGWGEYQEKDETPSAFWDRMCRADADNDIERASGREKKKRSRSSSSPVGISASSEEGDDESSSRKKSKKKKKKSKKKHQRQQQTQEGRMRAVSTDSSADVGVRLSRERQSWRT